MVGIRRGYVAPTGTDYAVAIPRAAHRDLSFVELFVEGENGRERLAEEASEVATLANVYGVGLVVHLPTGLDLGSPHEHVQDGALLELKAALDVAETVGASRAVLRSKALYGRGPADEAGRLARLCSGIRALEDYAGRRGIRLSVRVPQATLGLGEGLARLFEDTDVDVCLDTGLAALAGHDETDQATLLLERSERITHLHLRDVRAADRPTPTESRGVDWSVDVDPPGPGGDGPRAGDPDPDPDADREGSRPRVDGGREPLAGADLDRDFGSQPGAGLRGPPLGAGDLDFDRLLDPVRLGWSGTASLAVGTDDEGALDESLRRLDDVL